MTLRSTAALALVALAAATPSASAHEPSGSIAEQAKAIAEDCATHGRLTERYPLRALRHAKRTLPADLREFSDCERAIDRAIARGVGGPKRQRGADRVEAVIDDCSPDGSFEYRFRIATLRRALQQLPADIVTYTPCKATIRRELRRRA